MNKDKIGYLLLGIILGFGLRYLTEPTPKSGEPLPKPETAAQPTPPKAAPPLSPDAGPNLPAGHPSLTGPSQNQNSNDAVNSKTFAAAIESANSNPGDYILQMKAAAQCYQNGKLDEAIGFLTKAQNLRPDSFDALSGLGITYSELGKSAEAEGWLTKALKQNPNDSDTRAELAVTYYQLKNFDQAIAESHRALQNAPSLERALECLVKAHLAKGEATQANATLSKLSAVNPGNPNLPQFRSALEKLRLKEAVPSH